MTIPCLGVYLARLDGKKITLTRSTLKRSAAKSALWKVIGVLALVGVSWAAGVSAEQIGKVTIGYHMVTLVLYLFHERFWDRVKWGRIQMSDES